MKGKIGGSGIRTHGTLPHTRVPGVLLRPLRHPSANDKVKKVYHPPPFFLNNDIHSYSTFLNPRHTVT